MCFSQCQIYIRWLSRDRNFIRETPSGPSRLGSRKRSSVNRHFLIRELSCSCARKDRFYESIAFKDHLFANSRCPELLEGLDSTWVKVIPSKKGPDELHESKPTHELGPAGCQMKCQRSSPVLRYDEC